MKLRCFGQRREEPGEGAARYRNRRNKAPEQTLAEPELLQVVSNEGPNYRGGLGGGGGRLTPTEERNQPLAMVTA